MSNKFPTGKENISFSELHDWLDCSWKHKLKHIDKIDLSKPSPFLEFGTVIHSACENYVKTRSLHFEEYIEKLYKALLNLNWIEEWGIIQEWQEDARNILNELPSFLEETFPDWKYISVEDLIFEAIETKDIKFKGYIDCILKVKDKIFIIDWKTSIRGWHKFKKRDEDIALQLRLYKIFYAQKTGIPIKNIQCGFVILKRKAKPGRHFELLKVSVGETTYKRSLTVVNNMIDATIRGVALKNRSSCRFCDYYETDYCI